jgi:hypothetical protein
MSSFGSSLNGNFLKIQSLSSLLFLYQKVHQISKIKQYLLLFKNGLVTDISGFKIVHLSWFAHLQLMIYEKRDVIEEI